MQTPGKPSSMPREHGAWGMLLQPFLGSLIVLRSVNWTVLPALAGILLVFLIRGPLLVIARQKWVWLERQPEYALATRQLAVELTALLAASVWLASVWPTTAFLAIALGAIGLTGLAIYMTMHNRQRETWFQALSAAGLSGSSLAVCLSVAGGIPGWCWWWWALHAAHFLTAILVVHVRLDARIASRRNSGELNQEYKKQRARARRIQSVAAAAGLGLMATGQVFYGAAMVLSSAIHFRDLASAHTAEAIATPMTTVGKRALTISIAFTVLLVAGAWQ